VDIFVKEAALIAVTVVMGYDGEFKYGLCGCVDGKTCCRALWWNAWCFPCIPVAQLLNRFRWSPCATPTKMSRSTVFGIVVGMYLTFAVCNTVYGSGYGVLGMCTTTVDVNEYGTYAITRNCNSGVIAAGILINIVAAIFLVAIIVMLVKIRMEFRKHYRIEGNCCADFCTMWCCSCCSVIQMLRQTHDKDAYRYSCCSCMTGLPENAPDIV
jgi:Cys-rich protein (TIGR01571 family)